MGELKIKTKKNLLMLILAFTFVLAIAGTSAAAVSETSNVTTPQVTNDCGSDPIIDGTITVNEYGHVRPLEGATVTANSVSASGVILGRATTDASGYYSMNFYSTDTTFDIVASYMGCTSQTKRITVNNGPNYPTDPNKYGTANFELIPKSATLTSTGSGQSVYIQGQNSNGFAGVLNVRVDGTTYVAYCIDLFTPIEVNDVLLVNGPLPGTAGDLPPEVEWEKVSYILNKYNPSNQNEAAAIQCAIWYFTSVHYGDYNPSAPVGTYYQYMTAPRDGRIGGSSGSETVRNRALVIINEVNAATIPPYPNNITLTPQSTTVANGLISTSVTVTATVKDKDGNPLSGITVNFQTTQGTLSRTSGETNANGQVTSTLTLLNNRDAVVTASVTGNYGNLLYDDQYAAVRKQNLVARNVLPLVISDFSTIKTARTANVALTQTANSPVNVGDTVTYTVTATNNGPSTATGILISDIVPAGLSGVTVTPSVGTYYNGIWTIPTLANNAKATLTITGTATAAMAGLTTTNTATRIAQEQYNSRQCWYTASVYTKKADVTITNTANHSTLNVGDNGTFTIRVTNNGPDRANIQITDLLSQLPAGFTAGTPSTGSYNPTTGVWTITNLATGTANAATLVFSGVIQAAQAGTTIINHATATMTEYPQTVTIPDASIYVKKADVTLSQTGSYYQDTVTFIVTASNNGPDTATNIKISDVIPSGLTGVTVTPSIGTYDSNTGIWTIPELLNGAFATLNISGTGFPQSTIENNANITDQTEYNTEIAKNNVFNIYIPLIDLRVRNYEWFSGRNDNYNYNEAPPYVSYVRNYGPDDASNITIQYKIGDGFTYMGYLLWSGVDWASYDEETKTLTYHINYLPNGCLARIIIYLQIKDTGIQTPNLTTNASLIAVDQHEEGTQANYETRKLTVANAADIEVTQNTILYDPINQTAIITIHAKNNGPNDATGINITNLIPEGLTYSSHTSGEDYNPTTGIWNVGELKNQATRTIQIYTNVITTTGTITNYAIKTAPTTPYDWNPSNNAQTQRIIINGDYTPTVDLRVRNYEWFSGRNDNYNYNEAPPYVSYVRNYGPDDASNITIQYKIGDGFTYMGYLLWSGVDWASYDEETKTLTYHINYLPNGCLARIIIYLQIKDTGIQTPNLTTNASLIAVDQHEEGTQANYETRKLTVANAADIEVTQNTILYDPINQTAIITIHAKNNGPNDATGINITNLIPEGLTYSSHTSGEDYNPTTGIWNVGELKNQATRTIQIYTNVITTTGTITNYAIKTAPTTPYDWNPSNNAQTRNDGIS